METTLSTNTKYFRFILLSALVVLHICASGASVDTIFVKNNALKESLPTAVVLPDSYADSNREYPVLYLLHGGSGSFRDWLTKTPDRNLLHDLSDRYQIIIVTPEGSSLGYYFDSPLNEKSQYESFIAVDVVAEIDATFRTVGERKGRAIAGLSMGGHGAFFISARHPDVFCVAGSMSGVMNLNTETWKVPKEFADMRKKTFAELLGAPAEGIISYPDYSAVGLTENMKTNNVRLIFDCGVDDFLIETNRMLHQKLLDNGTAHDYTERPGGHTWEYWGNALPYQVLFITNVFRENGVLIQD
ncbi:alpha/beta hydrolase [Fulvivirga sedimenti]|uniref:Esterase family protein n=1 Tax=Fulvivirga sedimenti TaxID=2879465 RepID=A0A9X1KZY0_9BACT|nr:alpha/beta hydrolase family protein [Fulvivirga sedimenti]MCA6075144.1 esterase family protein [Fulvivirga sedimenti]MCA6076321.1 esterase family protein [Fulvivirga sedimenti]MCA6077449.1 esterase family protein [Fulvivirga sedimenti]